MAATINNNGAFTRTRNPNLKPPATKHPLLLELIAMQQADGRSMDDCSTAAGYSHSAFSRLRQDVNSPGFVKVADLGEALGYELKWVKKGSTDAG